MASQAELLSTLNRTLLEALFGGDEWSKNKENHQTLNYHHFLLVSLSFY